MDVEALVGDVRAVGTGGLVTNDTVEVIPRSRNVPDTALVAIRPW
jgi:hypothetical protein